jgi:hypothetical protein
MRLTCSDYRPQVAKYLTRPSAKSLRPEVARALFELEPDVFGLADGLVTDDELERLRIALEALRAKPARVAAQRSAAQSVPEMLRAPPQEWPAALHEQLAGGPAEVAVFLLAFAR